MSVVTTTRPLAPAKSTELSGNLTRDEAKRAAIAGLSEAQLTNGARTDCLKQLGEACLLKLLLNEGTKGFVVTAKDSCEIPGFKCAQNALDGAENTASAIARTKELTGL